MSPLLRLVLAAYRLALLACPREMREEYGVAMCADARAVLEERGVSAAPALLADVLATGVRERLLTLVRDVTYALRSARKTPLFAAVVVLTIGVAIAANAAIDGLAAQVLLRPLGLDDPGTLVAVWERDAARGWPRAGFTYPDALAVRRGSRAFASFTVEAQTSATLVGGGGPPVLLRGQVVDGDFFGTLHARPQLGRLLDRRDEKDGAPRVVVLSDATWHLRFGGQPVIGRSVLLGGLPATIVGVTAPGFTSLDFWNQGLVRRDFFVPMRPATWTNAGHSVVALARLRAGVSRAAADADLRRIFAARAARYPSTNGGLSAFTVDAREQLYGLVRPPLFTMVLAGFAVLAIACANVANLFLSRASAREAEVGIRFALGARRGRLISQMLTETSLYVLAGGLLGLAGSVALVDPIARMLRDAGAGGLFTGLGVDATLLVATFAATALAAALTGLVPALALQRAELSETLKGAGRGADIARGRALRGVLIGVELALTIALVASAAMSLRSFAETVARPLGFDPKDAFVATIVGASQYRYDTREKADRLADEIRARVLAAPGVTAAGFAHGTAFLGSGDTVYTVAGRRYAPGTEPDADIAMLGVGARDALRIALLAGRDVRAGDGPQGQPVALVNRTFAERVFGSVQGALGRRIVVQYATYDAGMPEREIVGVVADARRRYAYGAEATLYVPAAQVPEVYEMQLIVRAQPSVDVDRVVAGAVAAVDPTVPRPRVVPFAHLLRVDVLNLAIVDDLLGALAGVALLLAVAGVYAVVSYDVSRRTREIAVRITFGATARTVTLMIVRETLRLAAVGIVAGLFLAAGAMSLLSENAVELAPLDAPTLTALVAVLAAALLAGCALPALRAARTEPAVALRYE